MLQPPYYSVPSGGRPVRWPGPAKGTVNCQSATSQASGIAIGAHKANSTTRIVLVRVLLRSPSWLTISVPLLPTPPNN